MRYVLNTVLLLAVVFALWVWFDQARTPTADLTAAATFDARVPEIVREAYETRQRDRQAQSGEMLEPADCFVWGPFKAAELKAVRRELSRQGLWERARIVDRFLPERWIVYLGPYDNDIAVRAFVKQFRQQGYLHVRPILRGGLSFGVEIETFESQSEAAAWIESDKAPDVQGLRVTNRLGEPTDQVDLVFQDIDEKNLRRLVASQRRRKGTRLEACTER